MATQKGTHITNFDSTPPNAVNSKLHGGVVKGFIDTFELTDTADGDIAHAFKLPTDALLKSVKFASDDLGSAGTVSIGFYYKKADGTYAVLDLDAIAVDIDVNTAAVALTEYRFSAKGIETATQEIWELAGLSAKPDYGDIYLALTTATGTTADGTVTMQVEIQE